MVTLEEIWTANSDDLQRTLEAIDIKITGNLNHDRAVLALAYNDTNMLKANRLVSHPDFLEVMSTSPSLQEGLAILQEDFNKRDVAPTISEVKARDDSFVRGLLRMYVTTSFTLNYLVRIMDTARNSRDILVPREYKSYVSDRLRRIELSQNHSIISTLAAVTLNNVIRGRIYRIAHDETKKYVVPSGLYDALINKILTTPPDTPGMFDEMLRESYKNSWTEAFKHEALIESIIDGIAIDEKTIVDPNVAIDKLLKLNYDDMNPISRAYYLYSIWDLLALFPYKQKLLDTLNKLFVKYNLMHIFAEIPTYTKISPVMLGGRDYLSELIGTYATRPPTHPEILARILALD